MVIDEISMLTAEHFERIVTMFRIAEKMPCLVMMGDFWQLPVVDKTAKACDESRAWNASSVFTIRFLEQVRCKDEALQKKLNTLRTSVPSMKQLKKILRGHRAWKTAEPTAWDILELLRKHEDTTIVTCTRKGSAKVNDLAKQVLFEDRKKEALAEVPLDYEMESSNYLQSGGLKPGRLQGAKTTIFKGLRVFLTKNMSKRDDFVNGMAATVEAYDSTSKCLDVLTKTGKRLAVHLVTEEVEGHGRVTYFPVRVGYACTVPKIQGQTLAHICIWLDAPCCRAAAYVAMSRVKLDRDYLIAGKVCPRHFVPAR